MEDHIGLNSQINRQFLQVEPVLLTLTPLEMRMSCSGNHVDNIAVPRQYPWQSLNDIFDAFVRRQQTKREQDHLSFRTEAILVEIGIDEG